MRTFGKALSIIVALILSSQVLTAQVNLTDERSAEQKWNRMVDLGTFIFAAYVGHGGSLNQTPEQLGRWFGEFAARTWPGPGGMTLSEFVRACFMNSNLWPELQFEILAETGTEIKFRMTIPWADYFGETGKMLGVDLADFNKAWWIHAEVIADHLGFDMTHADRRDWVEFTVKTRS
jgi:hypothetical protein